MAYFVDGTPYTYWPDQAPAVNVGWLDIAHEFPTGAVPPEFVAALSELCRNPVLVTLGLHFCQWCGVPPELWPPTKVESAEGDFYVGHAEIRAQGRDGVVYAAPDMVIHYVEVHGYRPPDGFIDAVLGTK